MADKTVNRIVPQEGGKWYAIESSFDDGKTWHSSGTSAPTKEGAQKIIDNWSKGLTTDGLTREEAQKKANAAPGPKLEVTEPGKTKTVLSKEEAAKAGIKIGELPTQFELDNPTLSGSNRNVTDENGWIDNDENVHLNSRTTEAHNKVGSTDQEVRDYWIYKDPTQYKLDLKNSKLDKKDTDAADAEAKGKTETTDKTNQMSDSSKAKTDTTATGKFINPFQKEKEDADKDVENASILLDRAKQLEAKVAKKHIVPTSGNNISASLITPDKELLEFKKDTEDLAKELGIDISSLLVEEDGNTIAPLKRYQLKRLKKINKELVKIAEGRLTDAKTKQQETQANYTKAEEEAAKRKAESKPAPKAPKTEKAETEDKKDETEDKKDETKDPLEKAEELKQPQTPTDIKRFSNDLNRFVIQAYLNGDFGKKSSPNAIASMGFFILDKLGSALVNASQVARGMSPSAKSQWSKILDKQTELLGNRITAEWFLSKSKEEQIALLRIGAVPGASSQTAYENTEQDAITRAEQRDALKTSKLLQEQKGVAQSNVNALLARKAELQTLITRLRSDQGWDVYTQAMNAIVGTAKGLNTFGITDNSSSSSNKGFSDELSVDVKTGKVASAFVSGGISNNSSWNNSSAESLSKSNSLSQDALAYSKFKTGEEYANATREAKKAANEQLIERLEGQIEIIDKCIDSWGKDLGL